MTDTTRSDDVYHLLTMPIDKDMEAYLRKQGLSWFFTRRRKFQRFIEQTGNRKVEDSR